ncbi:MAG: hypothetical protein OKBPIBMD_01768 [Chlorobi bacterium]|nr:hypothetical protein [Chlorobiota bacterium]
MCCRRFRISITAPVIIEKIPGTILMVDISTIAGSSRLTSFLPRYCQPIMLANPPNSFASAYTTCKHPISQATPRTISEIIESPVAHSGHVVPINGSGYSIYHPAPNLPIRVPIVNPTTPSSVRPYKKYPRLILSLTYRVPFRYQSAANAIENSTPAIPRPCRVMYE